MKKLVKILPVILLSVVVLSTLSAVCAATDPGSLTGTSTSTFDTMGRRIIGMVQAVGSIVSVLVLVILGVKFMMGSAEEKAEYKKTFIPYIVGAILVFAASNLASMIYGFANTLSSK